MWKRMQSRATGGISSSGGTNTSTSQRPAIGNPVLVESSLDENAYRQITHLSPVEEGEIHFPRRPTYEASSRLEPHYDAEVNIGGQYRPVSSVYSQPSPAPINTSFPRHNTSTPVTAIADGVSPPSSPDFGATQGYGNESPDISPIEAAPPVPPYHLQSDRQDRGRDPHQNAAPAPTSRGSSIPQLRREKRQHNTGLSSHPFESSNTSGVKKRWNPPVEATWDQYTGEPTTRERGKQQSVKPSQYNGTPDTMSQLSPLPTNRFGSTEPDPSSFRERLRKVSEPANAGSHGPTARPEWRGASGRAPLITPIEDQVQKPAFSAPAKKKPIKQVPKIAPPDPKRFANAAHKSIPLMQAVSRTPTPPSAEPQPPKDKLRATSPLSLDYPQRSNPSPPLSDRSIGEYTTSAPLSEPAPARAPTSQSRIVSGETPITRKPVHSQTEDRLASLFSSSITLSDPILPQLSGEPSLPVAKEKEEESTSVLNRPRPIRTDSLGVERSVSRKAVPRSPVFIGGGGVERANSKLLPKSPPELDETADLISRLQARLDNLSQLRTNLQRSIHQMTELMPQNDYGVDAIARRAEERRKVEVLKEDLADVRREEHELGLKLHRAFKRQAKEASYEPTTLWVRRVTG